MYAAIPQSFAVKWKAVYYVLFILKFRLGVSGKWTQYYDYRKMLEAM
jgi:hypothetical protein